MQNDVEEFVNTVDVGVISIEPEPDVLNSLVVVLDTNGADVDGVYDVAVPPVIVHPVLIVLVASDIKEI